jgi:hypothetical protein
VPLLAAFMLALGRLGGIGLADRAFGRPIRFAFRGRLGIPRNLRRLLRFV